ncbi:MAG: L,D-transpeptidase family protein [Hyphomicrobiaceae bacterium]|nr:L,D-transpeptidase family protein [Hyphomicrobiaceae bacterium]
MPIGLRLSRAALLLALACAPAPALFAQDSKPVADVPAEPPPAAPAAQETEAATTLALVPTTPFAQALSERLTRQDGKLSPRQREDRTALATFYAARRHAPVWTGEAGLTPAADALLAEFARADEWGLDAAAFKPRSAPARAAFASPADQAAAEFELSELVLKYARHAHGGRAEPTSLSRFIDRQLTFVDPARVLGEISVAEAPDAYLRKLHPQHPQFEMLRERYLALKRGDKLALTPPTPVKVERPPAAKGAAKPEAKVEPPKAEKASVKKLLVNMEQWRWMPDDLGDTYIWVNVPEFTLRVVKDGKVVHTERAIVGKIDKQTPIFSEAMAQVIFNPTWGVPDSIKKNEILPNLAKGRTRILARNNLKLVQNGREVDPESVDWSTADIRRYSVIQPSGGENVLGVVKFRFPNKHDVYMHDTPTKKLFNATERAFSHGCIRVREPDKFAELILSVDQGWTAARVAAAIKSGQENQTINLKRKIPVHLTYFTASVSDDGKLRLFNDVYGHEHRIAMGLEGKAHLLPKEKDPGPIEVGPVGSLAESNKPPAIGPKEEWARKALGYN